MTSYIIRRLFLLPITLFFIVLVNFIILNLAPGEPTTRAGVGVTGEASRSAQESGVIGEDHYLLFREHYGLTLPILWNSWPSLTHQQVKAGLNQVVQAKTKMSVQAYHRLRTLWGDRARFVMPHLLSEAINP